MNSFTVQFVPLDCLQYNLVCHNGENYIEADIQFILG